MSSDPDIAAPAPGIAPSRLVLLDDSSDSLRARLALIHEAAKSLDLQYYAINDDVTANLLIESLIRAAHRGVTVRLLIDDVSLGHMYKSLSALNLQPNVTVRVFNPVSRTDQSMLSRLLAFVAHLPRATRRMHNKALVADRRYAIIGGRNLGDEYFNPDAQALFKDLDIIAEGPAAEEIATSFETYWESPHATPITKLYGRRIGRFYKFAFQQRLRLNWKRIARRHGDKALAPTIAEIMALDGEPFSAPARFVADPPAKIDRAGRPRPPGPVDVLYAMADSAVSDYLIVSPYFVPGGQGLAHLRALKDNGVSIKVITNSLASTDVVAVHTGYRRYRAALLDCGVELWEIKPSGRRRPKQRPLGKGTPSYASLHAKFYAADDRLSMIGSLNLDPRSIDLNTESMLWIDDGGVNAALRRIADDLTMPDRAYRVTLEKGRTLWTTEHKGRTRIYRREPRAGIWRRMQEFFIRLLPVEDQL